LANGMPKVRPVKPPMLKVFSSLLALRLK